MQQLTDIETLMVYLIAVSGLTLLAIIGCIIDSIINRFFNLD